MRNPTDICLLCQVNLATKTNSHIFPRFLSTNFLGAKGKPRRGYNLDSENNLTHKPKVIQDSPKENYILCEECEAYFGILEGLSRETFINWQTKVQTGEFSLKTLNNEVDVVECNTTDKQSIRLLIYSIFWRASISETDIFGDFKIEQKFEEELRKTLMNYRYTKRTDYYTALSKKPVFNYFPTIISTTKSFIEGAASILYAPLSGSPYPLIIDRFSVLLFRDTSEIETNMQKVISNWDTDDCKIITLSEQVWQDTIVKIPLEFLAKQANST